MFTAFLIYPGVVALDLFGAFDALSLADAFLAEQHQPPQFSPRLCAIDEQPIRLASGPRILPDLTLDEALKDAHSLVIPGFFEDDQHPQARQQLAHRLQQAKPKQHLMTICTGAVIAAQANLLTGHRVTTHWAWTQKLQAAHPDIDVQHDALYVRDANVWSSAGVTAGIDLALAWIRHQVGQHIALKVAKYLVVYAHRAGGQSQFGSMLAAQHTDDPQIATAQQYILENLQRDLSVEAIARITHMSSRHFSRQFTKHVGMSPGQYVQHIRLTTAQNLLETTQMPLNQVAAYIGYKDAEQLRQLFQRHLTISPSSYRQHFHAESS